MVLRTPQSALETDGSLSPCGSTALRASLVPTARLELAQLSPLPPQDSVSTNFTTSAAHETESEKHEDAPPGQHEILTRRQAPSPVRACVRCGGRRRVNGAISHRAGGRPTSESQQ